MFESPQSWTRLQKLLFQFDEPTSRLYHVNIVSSIVLVILVIAYLAFRQRQNVFLLLKKWIFRKRYWWNTSSKQDYKIYVINALIKSFLLVPVFELSFQVSQVVIRFLVRFSEGDVLDLPLKTAWLLFFTAAVFIWDDFLRFMHHFLMHKIPFLWEFHKMHHSARVLTPVTLYRAHPMESVLAILRNSLSLGVSIGVFIYLFGASFSLWTLLGINGFGFIFNLVGANLRHSHIPLSFGPIENILISPIQHQVHHSRDVKHYDKNFGVSLALWDRLFGTLVLSKHIRGQKIAVGLNERFRTSLWRHYWAPLGKLSDRPFRKFKQLSLNAKTKYSRKASAPTGAPQTPT